MPPTRHRRAVEAARPLCVCRGNRPAHPSRGPRSPRRCLPRATGTQSRLPRPYSPRPPSPAGASHAPQARSRDHPTSPCVSRQQAGTPESRPAIAPPVPPTRYRHAVEAARPPRVCRGNRPAHPSRGPPSPAGASHAPQARSRGRRARTCCARHRPPVPPMPARVRVSVRESCRAPGRPCSRRHAVCNGCAVARICPPSPRQTPTNASHTPLARSRGHPPMPPTPYWRTRPPVDASHMPSARGRGRSPP